MSRKFFRRAFVIGIVFGAGALAYVALGLPPSGRTGPVSTAAGTRVVGPPPTPDLAGAEPKVAAALRRLRQDVLVQPTSADAWGTFGMSLDVHGYDSEAAQAYRKAIQLAPEFRWTYYLAANLDDSDDPEALEWYERSRVLRPAYVPLLIRLGQALFDAGQPEAADSTLAAVLEADSSLAVAYLMRGRIAIAHGDPEEARDWLLRGLEASPEDGDIYGILAEVHRRLGDWRNAEIARLRGRMYPRSAPVSDPVAAELTRAAVSSRWALIVGDAYLGRGQPEAALREFDAALEARPTDPFVLSQRGRALQRLGRFEEAAHDHRMALEIRPNFLQARLNLAAVRFRQSRLAEAIAHADTARQEHPYEADPYLSLGLYALATGQRAAAISTYRQGLRNAEFDSRLAVRLAWLLATSPKAELRSGEEAVQLAEVVCEIDRYALPATLDVLAAAYAEAGRFGEAIAAAREAARRARASGQLGLAAGIERRVDLYAAGRPYRERTTGARDNSP